MKKNFEWVSKNIVDPLWARAFETKQPHPIIKDEKAVEKMKI